MQAAKEPLLASEYPVAVSTATPTAGKFLNGSYYHEKCTHFRRYGKMPTATADTTAAIARRMPVPPSLCHALGNS